MIFGVRNTIISSLLSERRSRLNSQPSTGTVRRYGTPLERSSLIWR